MLPEAEDLILISQASFPLTEGHPSCLKVSNNNNTPPEMGSPAFMKRVWYVYPQEIDFRNRSIKFPASGVDVDRTLGREESPRTLRISPHCDHADKASATPTLAGLTGFRLQLWTMIQK